MYIHQVLHDGLEYFPKFYPFKIHVKRFADFILSQLQYIMGIPQHVHLLCLQFKWLPLKLSCVCVVFTMCSLY